MKPQDRTRAILESQLEPSTKLLLVTVADFMNEHDRCFPSIAAISRRSGYCERQVQQLVKAAEARGLMLRVQGAYRTPDIEIGWEAVRDALPAPSARGGRRDAKTAPVDEGSKDCTPTTQRLHPTPAKTAPQGSKDCTQSVHQASSEATTEAYTAAEAAAPIPKADKIADVWATLDGIRQKNIKGAGKLKLTAAMRKSLGERLKEHSASDLAAMVEWATGCRCGSKDCRACGWLQPKGYTHPKTYLRPDNCSEYVDKAKQAGAIAPTSGSDAVDWTESDAARLVVQRVLDSSAELYHRDGRILWLAKCNISHIGKREAWRGKGGTVEWIAAWRKQWPASVEAYERKQQQEGAAK